MTTHTARRYTNLQMNRLGLWLFILSESFLFAAFLAARFSLTGTSQPEHLDQLLGGVLTAILITSSFTAYKTRKAILADDQAALKRYLLMTIFIGLVFMVGVGFEWVEGFANFPPSTAYGTQFFALTGLHATHVLTGLAVLGFVYYNARKGRYTSSDHWGVEAGYRYWAFVDIVWLVVYPTLYLV